MLCTDGRGAAGSRPKQLSKEAIEAKAGFGGTIWGSWRKLSLEQQRHLGPESQDSQHKLKGINPGAVSLQKWPRQTKPKKGQFMNFSQRHSGTEIQCESCLFSSGKTPEFTKMGEIHEIFVLAQSLVWFAGATPDPSNSDTHVSRRAFLMATSLIIREETKGWFCKRLVLANVPSFRFCVLGEHANVPSFRFSHRAAKGVRQKEFGK